MSAPIQYASFLIRVWQENKPGEALPGADWHAEVEHIQSSQHWTFTTVEELLSFLHQQAENISVGTHPPGNKSALHKTCPGT